MLKRLSGTSGTWHIIYLLLFYLSTTLAFLFLYFALEAREWIGFRIGFLHHFISGYGDLRKNFLFLLAIFFLLNTIYLIKKRE